MGRENANANHYQERNNNIHDATHFVGGSLVSACFRIISSARKIVSSELGWPPAA
jgi:hypothetical protein